MAPAEVNRSRAAWLIVALYAVSGLISVAYEVLWTRMLSLQFGVSVFAVVLTVSTFMVGLGAGSLFGASRLRDGNPMRWLGVLEGGIALYALLLPSLLRLGAGAIEHAAAALSLGQWYALIALVATALLLLPAFAMGAGFPLALRAIGAAIPLGRVYGLNTLGAACGALLPLVLLPMLGWSGAIRVAAVLGLSVAAIFFWLSGRKAHVPLVEQRADARPAVSALVAYAAIGAASLMLEIAWTRLFGMVMLRTEYVLAIILATFLLGIGAGSLLAPRQHRQAWFVALPVVASLAALASLWLLPALSAWVERSEFHSLFAALSVQGMMLALLTVPVTLVLGAWLPLLHSRMNGGGMWLYGANSLGAAAGGVLAGLALIPLAGSAGTIVVAAAILLTAGLAGSRARLAWLALPVFIALAWPVARLAPVSALLPQAQAGSRDLSLYEDAVSMTHVVEQRDGQRLLLTDLQRMDASSEPTAVFVQSNQARLPLLLHAQPHSVLFLGLGTGISAAGSLPFPQLQRTAVELSQGAIVAAGSWFAAVNHDALQQTQVVRDDARHFLSASRERYDVIIGDVFHPDLVGLSSLLSLQQFQRARDRLSENGIFVQWLALNQFDAESLGVILRTFRAVFPGAQMFLDGMHLALVGPRGEFHGASAVMHNLARLSPAQQDLATANEGGWTWVGRYWGPIPATTGPLQDEWAPVVEFRLPRARYAGNLDVAASLRSLLKARPHLDAAAKLLGVAPGDQAVFERDYAATDLMARSWLAAMEGNSFEANKMMRLAYLANPKDRWVDYALADAMLSTLAQARAQGYSEGEALEKILAVSPSHVEAWRALWRLQRQAGDPLAQQSRARLLGLSPLDREAREVQN